MSSSMYGPSAVVVSNTTNTNRSVASPSASSSSSAASRNQATTSNAASSSSSSATPLQVVTPQFIHPRVQNAFASPSSPSSSKNNTNNNNSGALIISGIISSSSSSPKENNNTSLSYIDQMTGQVDLQATFWKPDSSRNEFGLLEALVRRQKQYTGGGVNTDYLPLGTRPNIELSHNFSTYEGARIDLSLDCFKLSRATQTISQLNYSSSQQQEAADAKISVSDMKEGLRTGIASLQKDEYFLIKYRDYSKFATDKWSEESRRDRMFAPLYVEKYFAVKVGSDHGVFIPVSESQFFRGHEVLSALNMSPEAAAKEKCFVSLTTDQFKSLGEPSTEFGSSDNKNKNKNKNKSGGNDDDDDLDLPSPPSMFDWSPNAMSIRWKRFARRQLNNVGKLTVKVVIIGGVSFFVYKYYQNNFGRGGAGQQYQQMRVREKKNGAEIIRDVVSMPIQVLGWMVSSSNSASQQRMSQQQQQYS